MSQELNQEGWTQVRQVGRHRQFRRPLRTGGDRDGAHGIELSKPTLASIVKQAGQVTANIQEAIELHIELMLAQGEEIPQPISQIVLVEVAP